MTLPGLAAAIFLIFLGTGPVNAATLNAVRPEIRATAMAGQLFIIHALGDAISPRIIGVVSDRSNLNLGLGSTLITMLLASVIFFIGSRYAPPLTAHAGTAGMGLLIHALMFGLLLRKRADQDHQVPDIIRLCPIPFAGHLALPFLMM